MVLSLGWFGILTVRNGSTIEFTGAFSPRQGNHPSVAGQGGRACRAVGGSLVGHLLVYALPERADRSSGQQRGWM